MNYFMESEGPLEERSRREYTHISGRHARSQRSLRSIKWASGDKNHDCKHVLRVTLLFGTSLDPKSGLQIWYMDKRSCIQPHFEVGSK